MLTLETDCHIYTPGDTVFSNLVLQMLIGISRITILQLWRSYSLHMGHKDNWHKIFKNQSLILETWLARSGSMPIYCRIKLNLQQSDRDRWMKDDAVASYTDSASQLISKLTPHIGRWKDIHLQLPFDTLMPLLYAHSTDAPLLKSLTIKHISFGGGDHWSSFGNGDPPDLKSAVFPAGEKLRILHLDVPDKILRIFQPWIHLEELLMLPSAVLKSENFSANDRVSFNSTMKMLRSLPNLQRCGLAIGRSRDPTQEGPVIMPALQSLSLQAEAPECATFLRNIVTPALERLTIHQSHDARELRSFLAKLNNPLQRLSLVRVHRLLEDDLFEYLQLVPSITHFHCTSPIGSEVLNALAPSESIDDHPSCLCPRLRFMELRCWRPFDVLVSMIEARCRNYQGVSRVEKFRLHLHCRPAENEDLVDENEFGLMKRLETCRDKGFDIKWQL